jgi:quercetin dioxygenase-like cupin family protein
MLSVKEIEGLGDVRIVRIDFAVAGDVVPKHVHAEDKDHATIVAKGRIKASSHDWEVEAGPGDLINFRPHEPHEIVALEDNTRIFQVLKKAAVTLSCKDTP